MQNRSPPRVRRTFDTRRDELVDRPRGMWRPAAGSERDGFIGEQTHGGSVTLRRLRVLVVDGDTRAADFLERLLHSSGYAETRVAYTGHAAVVFAREFRPEVVLADVDMPDPDSAAWSRTLLARAHFRPVFFVAVSARTANHDLQIEWGNTPARSLRKPITALDLSACLLAAAAAFR